MTKKKRGWRLWGCGGCLSVLVLLALFGAALNWPGDGPKATPVALAITHTAVPTRGPAPASATGTPAPAAFDEAAYVEQLSNGLFILAGGRNVEAIRVADGRANGGERVVIVSYLTTESTEVGYVDEWIDLFSALAATISADTLDVDSVALIAGTAAGQATGALSSRIGDLMAFHRGELARSSFLQRLETTTF